MVLTRQVLCFICSCSLLFSCTAAEDPNKLKEALKFVSGFFSLDSERRAISSQGKGLRVIGAGFSRTGTKSLEAALLRLGHQVYDTRSMMELQHVSKWVSAAEQVGRSKNLTVLSDLLADIESQGYTATLDFPVNLFAPALAQLRPSAKVLMSVRVNESNWVEAWWAINEILSIFVVRPWSFLVDFKFPGYILKSLHDFDWEYPEYPKHVSRPLPWFEVVHSLPGFSTADKRAAWEKLHRHLQAELTRQLPKDRFLVFRVQSGWAPLLNFLGIGDGELANEPFPNVNDRSSLQRVRYVMDVVACGLPLWIAILLWLLYRVLKCVCCLKQLKSKLKDN